MFARYWIIAMYCFRLCYLKEHIFQILVFAKFQDDAEIYFNVGALEQSMETISPPRFTFERQVLWWDGDARGVKAMTPLHYVNAQWIIYLNSQKLNLLSKLPGLLPNVYISEAFFHNAYPKYCLLFFHFWNFIMV